MERCGPQFGARVTLSDGPEYLNVRTDLASLIGVCVASDASHQFSRLAREHRTYKTHQYHGNAAVSLRSHTGTRWARMQKAEGRRGRSLPSLRPVHDCHGRIDRIFTGVSHCPFPTHHSFCCCCASLTEDDLNVTVEVGGRRLQLQRQSGRRRGRAGQTAHGGKGKGMEEEGGGTNESGWEDESGVRWKGGLKWSGTATEDGRMDADMGQRQR